MQIPIKNLGSIDELAKALNSFQAEIVTVNKEAENPFFKSKYANLGSIMKETQPILTKHGLSIIQFPDNLEGQPALTTIVLHTSGQTKEATMPLVLSKQDPQGLGSAITYARRYSYASALQIVIDDDDDGNGASQPKTTPNGHTHLAGMATNKQRETIKKHLSAVGISLEEQPGYLIETYEVDVPLTKEGASFVISELFFNIEEPVDGRDDDLSLGG